MPVRLGDTESKFAVFKSLKNINNRPALVCNEGLVQVPKPVKITNKEFSF